MVLNQKTGGTVGGGEKEKDSSAEASCYEVTALGEPL